MNTLTATDPAFVQQTAGNPFAVVVANRSAPALADLDGVANPLDGEDVGLDSAPALVDLDGDGDLDVVSGERYGTFPVYYMPEPGSKSLFAAGAGLLAWLARWRGRRRR